MSGGGARGEEKRSWVRCRCIAGTVRIEYIRD